MFHTAFEYLWMGESKLRSLNDEAENHIKTRGFSANAKIPPELSNQDWFLAVNDVAYDYCPTNRYLYLKKVEKRCLSQTWRRSKGYVIDQLIPELFNKVKEYITSTNLRSIELPSGLVNELQKTISEMKRVFDPNGLADPPQQNEIDNFFDTICKLAKHEALMASSFLSHRISNVYGLNIETEFKILFPFDFKLKMAAPELGIFPDAEIDFVLAQSILGEIKSEEWFNFYNIGLAAYALAFECDRKRNVNLGIIVCPTFKDNRKLPMYLNTANIKIIGEVWRKMFIKKRNKRIQLVKSGIDPGLPNNDTKCRGCGYYQKCWPK